MKPNAQHLPANKQHELAKVADIIRNHVDDVAMVILFGSYARGQYKEEKDLAPDRKSGHASDYDILVITASPETVNSPLWSDVQDACHAQKFSAFPKIIVHDIADINGKLTDAHYFYRDIIGDGCWLFNSGVYTLAEPVDLEGDALRLEAKKHFDSCFTAAKDFFEIYEFCVEKGKFSRAAFNLNQAAESALKTVLLVFTNYAPHEHLLYLLCDMAAEEHAVFGKIFSRNTQAEKDRFNLLDYAYIGARYDPAFVISKADLRILAQAVKTLLQETEEACLTRTS